MKELIYRIIFFSATTISLSCSIREHIPEDESDDDLIETIQDLDKKIESHKILEETIVNKEATISSNELAIKQGEERIKKKEEEVTTDIKIAIDATGKKLPTKCICCNWASSMTEESYDKLADKYHRGGFVGAKQGGGCEFWNSCPICTKDKYNEPYKNQIKEKQSEKEKIAKELDFIDKPLLRKSNKILPERRHCYNLMRKITFRKRELKQHINREREEKLKERDKKNKQKEKKLREREEKVLAQKLLAEKEKQIEELIKREKEMEEMMKKKEEEILKQERINTARNLLKILLDTNTIIGITGLSKEEIERLID